MTSTLSSVVSGASRFQKKARSLRTTRHDTSQVSRHTARWLRRDHVARHLSSRVRDRSVTSFPKVPIDGLPEGEKARDKYFYRSDDPRYLAFLDELDGALNAKSFNGVFSDHLVRSVGGYPAGPVEVVQRNNVAGVRKDRLAFSLSTREKLLVVAYTLLLFGEPIEAPLRLKKGGSPGAVDERWGRLETQMRVSSKVLDHGPAVRDLYAAGDHGSLIKADEVFFAAPVSTRLHRVQQDKVTIENGVLVPKRRPIAVDPYSTEFVEADKSLPAFSASGLGTFFRLRLRNVNNPTLGANLLSICFGSVVRAGYYRIWPFAFHHTTAQDIERKIGHWAWAECYDAARYDAHFLVELFAVLLDTLEWMGYSAEFCDYLWVFHLQPVLMHGSLAETPGWPLFGADPFVLKTFDFWGLLSGSGLTDVLGKFGAGAAMLVVALRARLLSGPRDLPAVLRGTHPRFGNLFGGDDNLCGGPIAADAAAFNAAMKPLLDSEPEPAEFFVRFSKDNRFLGNRVSVEGGRVRLSKYEPSLVANSFWKERDLHNKTNFEISSGFADRFDLLSSTEVGRRALGVIDELMVRHFGFTYTRLAARSSGAPETADAIFRLNPSSIFYKLDPSDVSEELLAEATFSYSADDNWRYLKQNTSLPTNASNDVNFKEICDAFEKAA